MSKISIIIPVYNEESQIKQTLENIIKESNIEIIVVDGGSSDHTIFIVKELGINIIISPQLGRAFQMNYGAKLATGDILLFLHGDTQLPADFKTYIQDILNQSGVITGAFKLKIEGENLGLRFIEYFVNLRSNFCALPYGDQAIFMKKQVFLDMGGFPELPIMEDFELINQLKKKGKILIAPIPVITSARRWQKLGIIKTTLKNQMVIIGYYLGISPQVLANWYRKIS